MAEARAAGAIRRYAGDRCQEGFLDLVEQTVAEGAARKAIARAIDAIAEADGERGAEQRATICTRLTCVYLPDPSRPRPGSVCPQPETEPDIRAYTRVGAVGNPSRPVRREKNMRIRSTTTRRPHVGWRIVATCFAGALAAHLGVTASPASAATVHCYGLEVTIPTATDGANTINGTDGPDVINGLGGNDTIWGNGGDDVICGGEGVDRIGGGLGNDKIAGNKGNDVISGNEGDDQIEGFAGDDHIQGGPGVDRVDGGDGNYLYFHLNWGNDYLSGNAGDDDVRGAAGNDTLFGGTGDDTLQGFGGADLLEDTSGRDYLSGDDGNDDLNARDGSLNTPPDWVYGGDGNYDDCDTDSHDTTNGDCEY